MSRFRIYRVSERYISFLRTHDSRVQYNKSSRPYVGIVLSIHGFNYYVPMESPKPNHANIRSGGPVFKIDKGSLGILGFNNMIPVPDSELISFDINSESPTYAALLKKQLNFLNNNRDIISRRAATVLSKQQSGDKFYAKICCDFSVLEYACSSYVC